MGAVPVANGAEGDAGLERTRERQMDEKEFAELRKEIIEARNLVIKTDNLLKNIHAEIKVVGRRQEAFERRSVTTGVVAIVIVAVLCAAAAVVAGRAYVGQARGDAEKVRKQVGELSTELETLRGKSERRTATADMAARLFAQLANEKAEERTEALNNLPKLDRTSLSALESRALDDRARSVRTELAAAAMERGRSAFRREDWKTAERELERALGIDSDHEDAAAALFQLGSARFSLKNYAGAVQPLEKFVAAPRGQRNVDWAYWLLGQSYEESNQTARAQEAYTKGLAHYGQGPFAGMMRRQLRKLSGASEPAAPAQPEQPAQPGAAPAPAGPQQ